jgi:integrase
VRLVKRSGKTKAAAERNLKEALADRQMPVKQAEITPQTKIEKVAVDVRWRLVRRKGVGLLRLPSTKTGESGERLIPLPSWAMTMLERRRLAIASGVQPVFPEFLGSWHDPSNVRRVWRQVRDDAGIKGLVSHTLPKTVTSFLDDAAVPTRKISDQLRHSRVSTTQDHYLRRKLTDRQTADALEELMGSNDA